MTPPASSPLIVEWLGAAHFRVHCSAGSLSFDPWVEGNPGCPVESVAAMGGTTAVIVSHGHPGHFGSGDAAKMAVATGSMFIGPVTLVEYAVETYGIGRQQAIGAEAGTAIMVGAARLEPFEVPHPPVRREFTVGGPPGEPNLGYLVFIDGKVLVHVGDTTPAPVYADIAASHAVDVAMLPLWAKEMVWHEQQALDSLLTIIGDLKPRMVLAHARYREQVGTPQRAAAALKRMNSSSVVIPMRPGHRLTVNQPGTGTPNQPEATV